MADFYTNDSMVDMFLFETSQLLETLEQVILSSDANQYYTEDQINEIFRIMHTIKGSSAMMMYNEISALSHTMEDIFYYIREEKPKQHFCSSLNDLMLNSVDFIKIELEKIRNRDKLDGDATDLIDKLKDFLLALKNSKEDLAINQADNETANLFKAVIHFENGCEMENIRAYTVIHNLSKIVDEMFYHPQDILDDDSSIDVIRQEGFHIYIKAKMSEKEIHDHLMQTIFLRDLELTNIDEDLFAEVSTQACITGSNRKTSEQDVYIVRAASEKKVSRKEHIQEENELSSINKKLDTEKAEKQHITETNVVSSAQSFISVSVAKLDKLMDLVGEMVIAEAMVLQNPDLEGLELGNFQKSARQLNKITSEIQDIVMSVRMVPLSATFQRMNRIVRDMCKKLNKEVNLAIIGEETEVDKNIIEHITDPLMHLVRNAIDHGIENADKRLSIGKPSNGTITLEAKNAGSDVHIIVKDNGRGLDKEKILNKAKEYGLLSTNEVDMSDSEIYKLILLPGFSTKDNVTEFSGRGVGMDVVAKKIEEIGGSISIDSEKDKGSQITLKIPLTLAIIDGMNLQVGKSTFTIPTISIQESFRPNKKDIIVDPDGNEMIMVRGECYPILKLQKLFKVESNITDYTDGIITMVSHEDKTICILSDKLLGQQQVVVKSLPEYISRYKKINGISGCTLLGDGSISLILDVASLIHVKY